MLIPFANLASGILLNLLNFYINGLNDSIFFRGINLINLISSIIKAVYRFSLFKNIIY